jgi:hypothetical protein
MPPFQLSPMVLHHGEKPLIFDLPERPFLTVLGEEAEVVEELAEADVGREFQELFDLFQQFLLRRCDHGIKSPIEGALA